MYLESRARKIPPLKEAKCFIFQNARLFFLLISKRYNRKMEKHSVSALHPSQVNTHNTLGAMCSQNKCLTLNTLGASWSQNKCLPEVEGHSQNKCPLHFAWGKCLLPYFVKTMVIFTSVVEGTLTWQTLQHPFFSLARYNSRKRII